MSADALRNKALSALLISDPTQKMTAAGQLSDLLVVDSYAEITAPHGIPGRPLQPLLVPPQQVKSRSMGSPEGRAALIHSLAHIEFNAINLALDILWRFAGMPDAFYRDWARVAREEAYHFGLLKGHLQAMGYQYGDMPAHDGLWEMAERTQDNLLARLALVPRTLEARGLDASPVVRDKLAGAGDAAGAAIIDIILRDEIGHVAVGNHWYRYECERQGADPVAQFAELATTYRAPRLRGPFNLSARREAGFTDEELDVLQQNAR
ncbi:ferritin-like domain-containing protein [Pusillimonas sp. ANT_WB101]|uniref:ferritin-like domain-containing protein n=1 Tax=Pusillimonas sp. ANT_WB101 TaxID=2597356 RepID=UPI0011EC49B9|nr:ferritin-like domain-containing protein [Pusillimonas sp. ANT_WB101]KAA0911635.1 ferritin-like domain-containing protein [Pusillimonas sp. ANT_WB101]